MGDAIQRYSIQIVCKFNLITMVILAEKYEYVGRLLRPGEEPTSYSDEEEETPIESSTNSSKSSNKDDIKDINSASEEKPKSEWPKQRKPTVESKNSNSSNSHRHNIIHTITNQITHSNNNYIHWNLWHKKSLLRLLYIHRAYNVTVRPPNYSAREEKGGACIMWYVWFYSRQDYRFCFTLLYRQISIESIIMVKTQTQSMCLGILCYTCIESVLCFVLLHYFFYCSKVKKYLLTVLVSVGII